MNIPYTVAPKPWPWKGLGNHRVIVRVDRPADAVCANIEWRRRDRHPESVGMRVFRLDDEQEVCNVCPLQMTRVRGKVAFAAQKAGRYAIYILPFEDHGDVFYIPASM